MPFVACLLDACLFEEKAWVFLSFSFPRNLSLLLNSSFQYFFIFFFIFPLMSFSRSTNLINTYYLINRFLPSIGTIFNEPEFFFVCFSSCLRRTRLLRTRVVRYNKKKKSRKTCTRFVMRKITFKLFKFILAGIQIGTDTLEL